MPIEAVFSIITLAVIGAFLFAYLANKIHIKLAYKTNVQDMFVGPLPFLGTIMGIIAGCYLNQASLPPLEFNYSLIGSIFIFSILGFCRDKFRLKQRYMFTLAYPAIAVLLHFGFPEFTYGQIALHSALVVMLLFCLKISSMVYEMPFILISSSALTHILFLFNSGKMNHEVLLLDFALLLFGVSALIHAFSGRRILISNSGIFATATSLALASILEPSGELILFSFFIPAMTIVFPLFFITFTIMATYFGNKLHKSDDPNRNLWCWSLNREKVINFITIIYLSLNFAGLLVVLSAPIFGYLSLILLMMLNLASFSRAFAKKQTNNGPRLKQISIFDIKIDAIYPYEVLERIKSHLSSSESGFMHIITADSLAVMKTLKDLDFKSKMEAAEMVVPDGAGIVWAADFIGNPLPSRVPGVALVSQICELSGKENYKVYFIGSKPGHADKAAEIIKEKYNTNFVGIEHGYFKADSEEENQALKRIADSKADIVFVALGVPRQEDFITKLRKYSNRVVAIGVGGSFDVISGSLPRAPLWMQNCGVEWLFRLWLEPKRFVRMLEIPKFVLKVMRYKFNHDS